MGAARGPWSLTGWPGRPAGLRGSRLGVGWAAWRCLWGSRSPEGPGPGLGPGGPHPLPTPRTPVPGRPESGGAASRADRSASTLVATPDDTRQRRAQCHLPPLPPRRTPTSEVPTGLPPFPLRADRLRGRDAPPFPDSGTPGTWAPRGDANHGWGMRTDLLSLTDSRGRGLFGVTGPADAGQVFSG